MIWESSTEIHSYHFPLASSNCLEYDVGKDSEAHFHLGESDVVTQLVPMSARSEEWGKDRQTKDVVYRDANCFNN